MKPSIILYIVTFILLLVAPILSAQNGQVKGKITDTGNNETIPFANIIVVGTQIGSTSDLDGNIP